MRILGYGVVRLVLFLIVWAVGLWLGAGMIWSTVAAAVITFAVSYLFLNRLRLGAAEELGDAWEGRQGRRGKTEQTDMDAEDAYTQGRYRDPEER